MEILRKPYQGVGNVIRFNWHFFAIAFAMMSLLLGVSRLLLDPYYKICIFLVCLIAISIVISLFVSFYVYDLSGLYKLKWLNDIGIQSDHHIININAGFDETSSVISLKFPQNNLTVFDFYDPVKHTEISIKRARKAYPPYVGTKMISTAFIPLPDNYANNIILIFSAHEIRNNIERCQFFRELNRVLTPDGRIIVLEHLRSLNNFLAYNIGFFHFLGRSTWYDTFQHSGLRVSDEASLTPFITKFTVTKNAVPS